MFRREKLNSNLKHTCIWSVLLLQVFGVFLAALFSRVGDCPVERLRHHFACERGRAPGALDDAPRFVRVEAHANAALGHVELLSHVRQPTEREARALSCVWGRSSPLPLLSFAPKTSPPNTTPRIG